MPTTTLEQIQKRETKLKQAIAGLGDAAEAEKKRELAKKLRRAQRHRRRMAVATERAAKTAPKPKAAAQAEETPPAE
jgi:hypothetical protein